MDTNQYMEMFLDESHEHLQSLNDGLLSLEQNGTDMSVLNEIFRNAHTLKGMSATMGYNKIAELTHEMEDVLDLLRKEKLELSEDLVDILFKCVDSLQAMIDNVGNGDPEDLVDVSDLVAKLSAISKPDQAPKAAPATGAPAAPAANAAPASGVPLTDVDLDVIRQAKNSGMRAMSIHIRLSETCLLKSARAYMVMNALDEMGDVIKSVPSAEDLEQEKFDHEFDVVVVTPNEVKEISDALLSISEIEEVKVDIIDPDKAAAQPAAPAAAQPAPAAAQPAQAQATQQAQKPAAAPAKKAAPQKQAAAKPKKPHASQSVRVDIEKLDTLMNLVGELVINKVRLEQIGQTHRLSELTETLEQMDRVTTDLQSVVMKVRMVPVSSVFNRFPRMVRDVAKELNKEINLTIEGEETELDRTVIDEIGDPLMHLLRNSLDHGVEHPDEREAKGKPRTGEIGLIARHEGNNVVIMVTDDGAGINADKIRNKAIEKGMISQEEAEALDDASAVRLIFLPGF